MSNYSLILLHYFTACPTNGKWESTRTRWAHFAHESVTDESESMCLRNWTTKLLSNVDAKCQSCRIVFVWRYLSSTSNPAWDPLFQNFPDFSGILFQTANGHCLSASQVVFRSRGAGLVAPVLTKMFPCLGMCPRHLRLIELKDWQQLHTLDSQIWPKPVDVHLDTVQIRRFHLLGFKLLKIQKKR